MAHMAPESPTTEELHAAHPLSNEAEVDIVLVRQRTADILRGDEPGIAASIGACAMTTDTGTISKEGAVLRQETAGPRGLVMTHRLPVWKPRTNPNDWHGLETEPETAELAYRTVIGQANAFDAVAIELAHSYHITRYGEALSFGWIGGRNIGNLAIMREVALSLPSLPLGIKNGLDGEVAPALELVDELNKLRHDSSEEPAPVVLLYRGGLNATTPKTWESQYRRALQATGGRMMLDVAHGSEMAHDPAGKFDKSAEGETLALEHAIRIAEMHGELPNGLMAEASAAHSPTDPHMSFEAAVEGVKRLHALRLAVSAPI